MGGMKWLKTGAVIVGAVIITALGIDAADTLNGSDGTLLSQVIEGTTGPCPAGMVLVENVAGVTCVDVYEAAAGEACPAPSPGNKIQSTENIHNAECIPVSEPDASPWRFVTRDQAMQACARAGKRLPTSAEWYQLSLGMAEVEDRCNVDSGGVSMTGKNSECVSPHGAYDLVGNVWEWVSDDVIDGQYNNRQLPETGFVAQIDGGGMAVVSSSTESELFGEDYFWSKAEGAYGIMRGGYYDSGSDAGIYTVHADVAPTLSGTAIGFRCLK